MIRADAHTRLDARAFVTRLPAPLGTLQSPESLLHGLSLEHEAPVQSGDEVRKAIRDMLRVGGFKPAGRSKPASEYLIRAASTGELGSINLAVDACNVVSLHSGVPISVIDLDRATPPLSISVAASDASYVFNASGQEMALGGLLCLGDAEGPCANAVKDSQRTKTNDETVTTLSVLWGDSSLPGRVEDAVRWYRALLEEAGATTEDAMIEVAG